MEISERSVAHASKLHASGKAASFTESVIREMTRLAADHDAINLGQGYPDFPAPQAVKEGAIAAIAADHNQYPITWGTRELRNALATKYQRDYGMEIDPEAEICVTCGSTEAMIVAFLGLIDPGDEVVVFEPFYESYAPDSILAGADRRYVTLHPPEWGFDPDELTAAFSSRTRAVVLNSPHNPTGKVFDVEELARIAELCVEHDAIAITDEIYEHITYDGRPHVPIATLPGMRERTVTISALSKTYAVTGWRVGWAIAAPELMQGIRPAHDFATVAAATPLQLAGVTALALPDSYYEDMIAGYEERRVAMMRLLRETGFEAASPEGAYYVMADITHLGLGDDVETANHLVEHVGVATVPGSSFFSHASDGAHLVRFAFCKTIETLEAAGERLRALTRV
jgi:aspartate/methionine/tyrosine aminotransferase